MRAEGLNEIPVGQRVTVRRRLPDGRASDSVGTISAIDAETVTLLTRRGEVRIPLDTVIVYRVVRPVPWRIETWLRRADVAVLGLDGVIRDPDDGSPIEATTTLVDDLTRAGTPVFVLSIGTDRVSEELGQMGLGHLGVIPVLTSTDDLDVAGPPLRAYERAHAFIEERLGRQVDRAGVRLTDSRPRTVEAAREFGWQGRIFTPPNA